MEREYQQFASRMRERRHRVGMSQEALAKHTGLSRPSIVNIELGRQRVLPHYVTAIAAVLGVSDRTAFGWFCR